MYLYRKYESVSDFINSMLGIGMINIGSWLDNTELVCKGIAKLETLMAKYGIKDRSVEVKITGFHVYPRKDV